MVLVGPPTGWCLPSPCIQWDKAACPSAFFLPTASINGTTWISTKTGLCMYVVFLHGCRVCWCLGVGLTSLLASPNFHFEVRMGFVAGCKGGVLWVWICAHVHGCLCLLPGPCATPFGARRSEEGCLCLWTKQVPACIALFSLYSMYLFPHRLVSSLPICPVEQYHLSIRLLHSYNQYVGLGSVCVLHVCMSVCVCGWVSVGVWVWVSVPWGVWLSSQYHWSSSARQQMDGMDGVCVRMCVCMYVCVCISSYILSGILVCAVLHLLLLCR